MIEKSKNPLRVAVIGASGIGKNHARWFHQHGCDVCAFVGSSPESVAKTQQILEQGFGFSGHGYADILQMLEAEKPDAVCVSSLPSQHFEHAMRCLESGAHVLCEKPLVYDDTKSASQLVDEAEQLVEAARKRNLIFGVQTQYAAAVPELLKLCGFDAAHQISDFAMTMETKNLKHGRDFEQIWIDLAPHPLSVLLQLAPGSQLDASSIQCDIREHETEARFQLRGPNRTVQAHILTRFNPAASVPLRRFALDGKRVDYAGRKDQNGEFRTYLTAESGEERELPDLVDILIGRFIQACQGNGTPVATGADGAQNLRWLLEIKERGQGASQAGEDARRV